MLIDAAGPNEVEIASSYGFKKVITLLELMTLYPSLSPLGIYDFFMSEQYYKQVHQAVLSRYGMTADELRSQLQFSAIVIIHGTFKTLSFVQIVLDIASSVDGTLLGKKRQSAADPQPVKIFSTDPDLLWASDWPNPRLGARVINIMVQETFKAVYGFDLEVEMIGKPYDFIFSYVEDQL